MCERLTATPDLQRLKGQHLCLPTGLGFEGEPGLGEEGLDEGGGPALDALEPVLDDRGELVQ